MKNLASDGGKKENNSEENESESGNGEKVISFNSQQVHQGDLYVHPS